MDTGVWYWASGVWVSGVWVPGVWFVAVDMVMVVFEFTDMVFDVLAFVAVV